MPTKITDNNIHNLVQKYINDKDSLPEDMQKISIWDVSRVTNMSKLFYGCESFDKNINGWNVSNVTNMSFMFFWL